MSALMRLGIGISALMFERSGGLHGGLCRLTATSERCGDVHVIHEGSFRCRLHAAARQQERRPSCRMDEMLTVGLFEPILGDVDGADGGRKGKTVVEVRRKEGPDKEKAAVIGLAFGGKRIRVEKADAAEIKKMWSFPCASK